MERKVKIHRVEQSNGPTLFVEESELRVVLISLFSVLFGFLLVVLGIKVSGLVYGKAFIFLLGIAMILFAFYFYSDFITDYIVDETGVYAKYPFQSWRLIPWSAFQEVCVCYGSYNVKTRSAFVYICFVKHGEKKNHLGRWKAGGIFHHRRIISMDYSKKLLEEVRRKCPYEVPDLRNTQPYKLSSAMKFSNK